MKKYNFKNQNGAISAFVMISMMFFLVTIIGVYMISSRRAQTQTESLKIIQSKYYNENTENIIYESKIANETDIIPIYTKEQLWTIGTGNQVEIEGRVYTFSSSSNYILKNDIVINKDDVKSTTPVSFSRLNKNNFEIYYYNNGVYSTTPN